MQVADTLLIRATGSNNREISLGINRRYSQSVSQKSWTALTEAYIEDLQIFVSMLML